MIWFHQMFRNEKHLVILCLGRCQLGIDCHLFFNWCQVQYCGKWCEFQFQHRGKRCQSQHQDKWCHSEH